MAAKFITLDGVDGSGKSTHVATIKAWFERRGLPVLFTREPGGTALGESLRRLLLDPAQKISLDTEILLMFAARRQHLEDVVWPALAKGVNVVSDRFTDATFAYQGGGRGADTARIKLLEEGVQGDFGPDLTLVLDVPPDVSASRVAAAREKDRFELEMPEFFARVRDAYLARAAGNAGRCRLIDSNRGKDEVKASVEAVLDGFFGF